MELRHLRYFVAVAEEGGFSRAARRLHVVQPTLSMQIRDLETELGGPLFDRGTRRTRLTPAGRAFLTEARRVLAQAEHAQAAARSALRGETGSVRIGVAGAAVFGGILTARIRAFHEARPLVRIELREAGPRTQRAAILAGELDVGYSALAAPAGEPRLASTPASSVSFLVALPAGHPLAGHETLSAGQLTGAELIEYATGDDRDEPAVPRAAPVVVFAGPVSRGQHAERARAGRGRGGPRRGPGRGGRGGRAGRRVPAAHRTRPHRRLPPPAPRRRNRPGGDRLPGHRPARLSVHSGGSVRRVLA